MEKVCSKCGISKDLESCFQWQNKAKGIKHSACKDCHHLYETSPERRTVKARQAREHRAKNPEPRKAYYRRWIAQNPDGPTDQYLKYRFGFGIDKFREMAAAQDWVCALCSRPENGDRRLSVDHDHSCCPGNKGKTCGKCVRGLVCQRCNNVLGNSQDNIRTLERAVDYIRRYAKDAEIIPGADGPTCSALEQVSAPS